MGENHKNRTHFINGNNRGICFPLDMDFKGISVAGDRPGRGLLNTASRSAGVGLVRAASKSRHGPDGGA